MEFIGMGKEASPNLPIWEEEASPIPSRGGGNGEDWLGDYVGTGENGLP